MKVARWGLLGFLLLVPLLWAAEPWKGKPYTEWTKEEVRQAFTDSPWAHPYTDPHAYAILGPMRADASGTVQWASALTVRQAIVRQKQLQGTYDPDAAARFLDTIPGEHVILVFGPSARLFEWATEEQARQAAHLKLKRAKKSIPAASVRYVQGDVKIVAAEFRFPRVMDGEPAIPADEEEATFVCRVENIAISVHFDLRKMVRDGKPDL